MDEQVFRRIQPREFINRFLDNNVRPDTRTPTMARKLSMTTGSVNTAVGSAMIKLGRTTVVAGVQATLIEPSSQTPEEGLMEFAVEILATASLNFRQVRASDDAIVLTHNLRQWLDPHIDRKSLCVESELLAWQLSLTVYIIDNDGNLDDAVVLAAVAALKNVLLPTVTLLDDIEQDLNEQNNQRGYISKSVIAKATHSRSIPLQLDNLPLVVSFALFNNHALIDPTSEEEASMDARMAFLLSQTGELRAVDKPGGKPISDTMFQSCLKQAKERVGYLVEKLNKASEI